MILRQTFGNRSSRDIKGRPSTSRRDYIKNNLQRGKKHKPYLFDSQLTMASTGHIHRISSTSDNLTQQQRSRLVFEQMILNSDQTFKHEQKKSEIIITKPSDLRIRLKGRIKFHPTMLAQKNKEEVQYEKQKIITNRTLIIKFAEKIRPTNASLSKRERLNLRANAYRICNQLKESQSLTTLDKILSAREKLFKIPNRFKQQLTNNISRHMQLAQRLQLQVKDQIPKVIRSTSLLNL